MWVALFFWLVMILFSDKPYYPFLMALLLSLVAVLLVWFYRKDLVAGYIFRIRHNPEKGQRIQTETVKGFQPDLVEDGTLRVSIIMLDPAYLSLAKERLAKLTAVTQGPGQ